MLAVVSWLAIFGVGFAIGAFAAAARLVLQQPLGKLPDKWQHDNDFRASLTTALVVIPVALFLAFLA